MRRTVLQWYNYDSARPNSKCPAAWPSGNSAVNCHNLVLLHGNVSAENKLFTWHYYMGCETRWCSMLHMCMPSSPPARFMQI